MTKGLLMSSETPHLVEELRAMIDDGRISLEAVHRITGIEIESLQSFLDEDGSTAGMDLLLAETPLMPGDAGRLSTLIGQLTVGLQIDDDERVKSILESLVAICGLTAGNLARLLDVDESTVNSALDDISTVPAVIRYRLGVRGSYLINAANQARR